MFSLAEIHIYWTNIVEDKVERSNLNGEDRQVLAFSHLSFTIASYGDYIFFFSTSTIKLMKVPKDGSGAPEEVGSGTGECEWLFPYHLSIYNGEHLLDLTHHFIII